MEVLNFQIKKLLTQEKEREHRARDYFISLFRLQRERYRITSETRKATVSHTDCRRFKPTDTHSARFPPFKLDQTNLLLSRVPCQRHERPSRSRSKGSGREIRKTLETHSDSYKQSRQKREREKKREGRGGFVAQPVVLFPTRKDRPRHKNVEPDTN